MPELLPHIHVETAFHGCNVGAVVTTAGVVLVDAPMLPSDAQRWRQIVSNLGPLRYLLHTEPHWDHLLSNFLFPEATIIAHELIRETINPQQRAEYRQHLLELDPAGAVLFESGAPRLPDITFGDRLTLYLGEHRLELCHLPGHTLAETAIWIPEANVLFTGDNVVNGVHPYMGDSEPLLWLEALAKLKSYPAQWVVPGHGEIGPPDIIVNMENYLKEVITAVETAIYRGWSRSETIERVSFLDRFPVEPDRATLVIENHRAGIGRIYDSLS